MFFLYMHVCHISESLLIPALFILYAKYLIKIYTFKLVFCLETNRKHLLITSLIIGLLDIAY